MNEPKVSATLLEFVEPLFLMPSGPPRGKFSDILEIAVMVWNAVTFDDHQGTNFVPDLRSRLQLIDDPNGRALMLALVDDLIERKRTEFAHHIWAVGDWEIFLQPDGEPRVRVEAREIRQQA